MATSQIGEVIQHLRRTVRFPGGPQPTDGQLLTHYLHHHDEAALAALVRRHGPMVWGVCRRVLWNHQDCEDAFQATFLVLVRKAASIASRELLANWLYGVAHQTALKARATTARRRTREKQVTEMPEPELVQQDQWRDLQPLLDQELSRLPDKYRVPIVLCDLEGKTRKEAARQLGVPEGTVAGRLARARAMLAKRLSRHGIALSSGTLAAVLSENASASVPISVLSSTIKAVTLVAAGQTVAGVMSNHVVTLAEGVVKAMLMMKLTTIGAVLFVMLGLVTLGGAFFVRQTEAAQDVGEPSTNGKANPNNAPAVHGNRKVVDGSVDQAKPEDLTAKQIMERMVKVYADCKSYQDSGMVKTLFVENDGKRTVEKAFTTAFVRPSRFRFEFKEMLGEQQMRYIIWSNGKEVQTWWDVKPGIEKPQSIQLALGAAAGVSDNSSLTIAQLLLPDSASKWRRLAIAEPKRAKDGKLDKVDCFRVEGKYGDNPITLWIDRKTYLVRQIDEQAKFDDFRIERTTIYNPTIDEKVADKLLEFDPPVPK